MEYRASIANPDQWLWSSTLWRFDIGACGPTHIYVWEDSLEEALEIAAAYIRDRGWNGLFTEPELDDAREELGAQASDEAVFDAATQEMTYTESGYLLSYEWWGREISGSGREYQQVRVASQILTLPLVDEVLDVAIDPEWDTESEVWLRGRWAEEVVPSIVARLRPFCDFLLPVTMFPHFLVPSQHNKRWIVPMACEQYQAEAVRELLRVVSELNLLADVEVSWHTPTTENWVEFAQDIHLHEGVPDSQQYVLRQSVILRVLDGKYSTPIEVEFAFLERHYEPDFQEF